MYSPGNALTPSAELHTGKRPRNHLPSGPQRWPNAKQGIQVPNGALQHRAHRARRVRAGLLVHPLLYSLH